MTAHSVQWRGFKGKPVDGPVYEVQAWDQIYARADETEARRAAIEEAHRRSGVPPFRSLLRQSSRHATATRYGDDDDRKERR